MTDTAMTDAEAAVELGEYIRALEELVLVHQEASRLRAEESLLMLTRVSELTKALNDLSASFNTLVQQLMLSGVIPTPDLRGRAHLT